MCSLFEHSRSNGIPLMLSQHILVIRQGELWFLTRLGGLQSLITLFGPDSYRDGKLPPLYVFKDNQCLISCKVTDYTFVTEDHMRKIFHALNELNIHLNVMQNSAISFSFCIDFRESKVKALIQTLQHFFEVYYNTGLTLVTIKNYDEESFETFRKKPG